MSPSQLGFLRAQQAHSVSFGPTGGGNIATDAKRAGFKSNLLLPPCCRHRCFPKQQPTYKKPLPASQGKSQVGRRVPGLYVTVLLVGKVTPTEGQHPRPHTHPSPGEDAQPAGLVPSPVAQHLPSYFGI